MAISTLADLFERICGTIRRVCGPFERVAEAIRVHLREYLRSVSGDVRIVRIEVDIGDAEAYFLLKSSRILGVFTIAICLLTDDLVGVD